MNQPSPTNQPTNQPTKQPTLHPSSTFGPNRQTQELSKVQLSQVQVDFGEWSASVPWHHSEKSPGKITKKNHGKPRVLPRACKSPQITSIWFSRGLPINHLLGLLQEGGSVQGKPQYRSMSARSARWWQLKHVFVIFTSKVGEDFQFDEHVFLDGLKLETETSN